MRRALSSLALVLVLVLAACGGRKTVAPAPVTRDFPSVDIPSVYTGQEERLGWLTAHFWDRFTDTARVYGCDSMTVNGVLLETVEEQFGTWATLLGMVPLPEGAAAVDRFYGRLDSFARKYPESNVFKELVDLTKKYLYDANSPVRSEDLYLPFVRRLGQSDLVDSGYRKGYAWDARMCDLNRTGTPAADFSFTDSRGRVRTLYGIRADYVLLIFGNPGCHACQEMMEAMSASSEITALIASGRLKVVDVYIDEEVGEWKAHIADYPSVWINGYDHNYLIRRNLTYNVRAIPSMYLLDADKTVLLKDAPQEKVLSALAAL
ncbi:MAG: DUF5106 domain-containing protein [Bacteroidales bacterium]|nr:DUF5106 domain-containing protein [Bacteroidales bacterium]